MFDGILSKAEIETGTHTDEAHEEFINSRSKEELESIALGLLNEMKAPFNLLLSMVKTLFSEQVFESSKIESLYNPKLSPDICEIRIRPENKYYIKLNKLIPRPDNPEGFDATGLEISFKLLKGYSIPGKTVFPRLYVQFSIWGQEERLAFGGMLKNYYRIIELLLSDLNVEFFTACPFVRLDKLKTKNPFSMLSAYYQADDDEESTFSLERTFSFGESYSDITRMFLVFAALYDSCLAYLYKKRNYDKILSYYQKLKTK